MLVPKAFRAGLKLAAAALSILTAFPAFAQEKLENPYLYRAQKGSKVIHLFGTMHAGIEIEQVPEKILSLIDNADVVANELGMKVASKSGEDAFAADKPLSEVLSPKAKQCLAENLPPLADALLNAKMSPSGLKQMLTMLLTGQLDKPVFDFQLAQYALQSKETVLALDDEEILKPALAEIFQKETGSEEREFEFMLCHLGEAATLMIANQEALKEIYLSGVEFDPYVGVSALITEKVRPLYKETLMRLNMTDLVEDMLKVEPTPKALLDDRNRAWIPKIEAMMEKNDRAFLFFGAAHLFGPAGVLKLLEEKGYTVTRVAVSDL